MSTDWINATRTTSNMTLGNFSRFIDADALQDAQGGVDFNNTFSSENPFAFTVQGPIFFLGTNRNDPT